jgi:hypothetical protein
LWIMGPVFLIVLGLLVTFYLDFAPLPLTKMEILPNFDHSRALAISEEDFVLKAISTPDKVTSSLVAQDGDSSTEQPRGEPETQTQNDKGLVTDSFENPVSEGIIENDGPPKDQSQTNPAEEVTVTSAVVEVHVHENLTVPGGLVFPQEQQVEEKSLIATSSEEWLGFDVTSPEEEKGIEELSANLTQERNDDEDTEMVVQPFESSESTSDLNNIRGEF